MQPHLLQKWTKAKSRLALLPIVGTVRCLRSLHRPRHRPHGMGLSSATITAPLVAAPSTRAHDHLGPQHCAVCATSAQDNFKPAYHKDSMGVTLTSYAHSVASTECAYGVGIMMVRSLRYQNLHKSITSCTSVTPTARQPCSVVSGEPVGRTGDEPDEGRVGHDGWARLRAEVATGRALGARGI